MTPNTIVSGERAVSPIVGATLLIGISVILASVIGTVVFAVGVGPAETPEVTLSFEVTEDDDVVLRHEGGAPLKADEVVVIDENGTELGGLDSDLHTGERQTIATNATDTERISVVWRNPSGDTESVLATFKP